MTTEERTSKVEYLQQMGCAVIQTASGRFTVEHDDFVLYGGEEVLDQASKIINEHFSL